MMSRDMKGCTMAVRLLCTILLAVWSVAEAFTSYHRDTPLMQWNAWNTFSVNGNPLRGGRKEYQEMADAMISSGMADAGYRSISTVCTDWIGRLFNTLFSALLLAPNPSLTRRDPVTKRLQENRTLWPG